MVNLPETQYAVQFTAADQIEINAEKPVYPVGPHDILLEVEACGICFSDTKLLHAFDTHPRKSEVIDGMEPQALSQNPSYKPGSTPAVPGHEPVGHIVKVGHLVEHFKVGDRVLVQADWKHLLTAKSNAAFGYNFEGALQQWALIDERCVVRPDGEQMLIHVSEEPSAASIGLIEPWATVEGAYSWKERGGLKEKGTLLVVLDDPSLSGLLEQIPLLEGFDRLGKVLCYGCKDAPFKSTPIADLSDIDPASVDDIIYVGHSAETVSKIGSLAAARSLINLVLGGKRLDGKPLVDIGRIHYDFIRYCGTPGDKVSDGYSWIPEDGAIRDNEKMAIVGAAGPMGLMHTMRATVLGLENLSIDCTDLSDERLDHLETVIGPVAGEKGVSIRYLNTTKMPMSGNYTYMAVMVPVPALMASMVGQCTKGSILNAFAGIPAGNATELDLQAVIDKQIFMIGTSGSEVSDMRTVVSKIQNADYDTTISLDAITGMAGFKDAIDAVMNRTSGGKIMVFPHSISLPFIRLSDLSQKLPQVAKELDNGKWTKGAEQALRNLDKDEQNA